MAKKSKKSKAASPAPLRGVAAANAKTSTVAPAVAAAPVAGRLLSLDALRGFDMFWIIGADEIVEALGKISHSGPIGFIAKQLQHAEWEGFRFEDLVFPLFVFMMGVAIPFSLRPLLECEGRAGAHVRVVRRALLLWAVGVLYYGGFANHWPEIRLVGVLQRIAACYLVAAVLFLNVGVRGLFGWCGGLLLAYWALLSFVPIPGMDHVSFAPGENWPNWVDLHYLPGRLWDKTWDPEGLLGTVPAVGTALLGVLAGLWVGDRSVSDRRKVAWLAALGAVGVVLGFAWGLQFPVIKKLWTSSYVLVAGGFSALLLAAFYQAIDVWKWRRGLAPLLWIGTNSLTIYLAVKIIDFEDLAARFVGGDIQAAWGVWGDLLLTLVSLGLALAMLRFLYNRKIFLRL